MGEQTPSQRDAPPHPTAGCKERALPSTRREGEGVMTGYLIGEEGPLAEEIVSFGEEKEEWRLGRSPHCDIVLADPTVSQEHLHCQRRAGQLWIDNRSTTNPVLHNGQPLTTAAVLTTGDIVQIGKTFFRFSNSAAAPSGAENLLALNLARGAATRWLLKVLSGPNAGAEFDMQAPSATMIGSDGLQCTVVLHDRSVSHQHALLTVDEEENVAIRDLGSRNGLRINDATIQQQQRLQGEDLIVLGTTSLLLIDRQQSPETLLLPAARPETAPSEEAAAEEKKPGAAITPRHLLPPAAFFLTALALLGSLWPLFHSKPLPPTLPSASQIAQIAAKHGAIESSFNAASGNLFLRGHVASKTKQEELLHDLQQLPAITKISKTLIIDELVLEDVNAYLVQNPLWKGVALHSPRAGQFIVRGYLPSLQAAEALSDYLNIHFPYPQGLHNQTVVESNLQAEVERLCLDSSFAHITFELKNGTIRLFGKVAAEHKGAFEQLLQKIGAIEGMQQVKNFVTYTSTASPRVDLSDRYQVTGHCKKEGQSQFVIINGQLLGIGDCLDGMMITTVATHEILLETDGLKFKIHYNLQ